jgi:hypothetical protein
VSMKGEEVKPTAMTTRLFVVCREVVMLDL